MKKKQKREKEEKKERKHSKKVYSATLKLLGKNYHSDGLTVREALEQLSPLKGKGIGILTITDGTVTRQRVLGNNQTFALFSASPLMREIALKNVSMLF